MACIDRWFWQRHITLGDCLKSYFSAEQLTDDNAYRCDHCNRCYCIVRGFMVTGSVLLRSTVSESHETNTVVIIIITIQTFLVCLRWC